MQPLLPRVHQGACHWAESPAQESGVISTSEFSSNGKKSDWLVGLYEHMFKNMNIEVKKVVENVVRDFTGQIASNFAITPWSPSVHPAVGPFKQGPQLKLNSPLLLFALFWLTNKQEGQQILSLDLTITWDTPSSLPPQIFFFFFRLDPEGGGW